MTQAEKRFSETLQELIYEGKQVLEEHGEVKEILENLTAQKGLYYRASVGLLMENHMPRTMLYENMIKWERRKIEECKEKVQSSAWRKEEYKTQHAFNPIHVALKNMFNELRSILYLS